MWWTPEILTLFSFLSIGNNGRSLMLLKKSFTKSKSTVKYLMNLYYLNTRVYLKGKICLTIWGPDKIYQYLETICLLVRKCKFQIFSVNFYPKTRKKHLKKCFRLPREYLNQHLGAHSIWKLVKIHNNQEEWRSWWNI